jgi:hypothetical protein
MRFISYLKKTSDRSSKNVRPNRNESGFMTFVGDYVAFSDFPKQN